jgi:HPt (histidine-containing phosphotransfer) domain-containing protein
MADSVPEPLRQRYIGSFAEKRAALETALSLLSADPLGAMTNLRALAHKISGSAGMYGFEALGQQARAVVHAIDDGSGSALVVELVRVLIDEMQPA